ncbi:tRNA(His) guanylyltransferase Thg1 family protein [Dysgonomonas sp. ZJ709]|uniref:tRNA(His) guanylyltransferase Thg1 family protein n=1 Tax=Dysgonomonas sp. ZJ709 TaxID=2709797 RepID=UPI0013EA5B95|nr:tRNA(His) guanylyltransferase Thg1 family protein [Dysgonomonas sp. ZJ709]
MNFNELDKKMRVFETIHDLCVSPEIYIVARIDGRGFTKLTKEKVSFETPFDVRFRDYMVETTKHLMDCGFKIIYGYTQSDEISLLFHLNDNGFSRKTRKLNSVLAGEASAKFSVLLGQPAAFDCRISELPNIDLVIDYFRWRNEDSHRNSLNAHCYWLLRKNGLSKTEATKEISGMSIPDKNELLFSHGINYNELPSWQKRGTGLYSKSVQKEGINKKTKEKTIYTRNELYIEYELPIKEQYEQLLRGLINEKIV